MKDPDGRKKTKDGWICGMVGTLVTIGYTIVLVGSIWLFSVAEETDRIRNHGSTNLRPGGQNDSTASGSREVSTAAFPAGSTGRAPFVTAG